MEIVDGKIIANKILSRVKRKVSGLEKKGITPELAVVLVGNDKPSHAYVTRKGRAAEYVGVRFHRFEFSRYISKKRLIREIQDIQSKHDLSGMIVQLPLPDRMWKSTREVTGAIDVSIDVDCLSHLALGRVMMNENALVPPTPDALLEILRHYKIPLKGKEICIIGRGELIGKPLSAMLAHYPVTVSMCGKSTKDLSRYTKLADIVISGVGKPNLITKNMIKKGAIVLDAGTSFYRGKLVGDVDFKNVSKKTSLITPVPGGVGPITVAKLLENVVLSAEKKSKKL